MILITGGTGLIGSHLLFRLTSQGQKVRALKRTTSDIDRVKQLFGLYSKDAEKLLSDIEWVEGDILDYPSLLKAMNGVSYVYHTAAVVSYQESDPRDICHNNIKGTLQVVNACLACNVKKLCHVSSLDTFDSKAMDKVMDEQSHWIDNKTHSIYAISKHQSEQFVWQGIYKGLSAVIVHPGIVLGPGFWDQGFSGMFRAMAQGMWFYPPGGNGFVDVRDLTRAMMLLMDSLIHSEQFIIVSESRSYKEFLVEVADTFGSRRPFIKRLPWMETFLSSRLRHVVPLRSARYTGQKIIQQTEFTYTPLTQTIADICARYLEKSQKISPTR